MTVNRGAAEDGPQVTKIVLGSKDAVVAEMLTPLPAESLADRYPLDPTKYYYPLYLVQGLTARKMTRFMHHEDALREGLLRKVERVEDGRFSNRVLYLEPTKKGGKEEQVFDTQMYFISHRWLSPSLNPEEAHPDDADNAKLRALCRIVEKKKFFI